MSIRSDLVRAASAEFAQTRSLLARVPNYRLHWRPHPTSWTLGELAGHLAMLPSWVPALVRATSLDVMAGDAPSLLYAPYDREAVLETFDFQAEAARCALFSLDPERLEDLWTLRAGDTVLVQDRREDVLRSTLFQHPAHHRGQLTVYFRMLEIPLPQSVTAPAVGEV